MADPVGGIDGGDSYVHVFQCGNDGLSSLLIAGLGELSQDQCGYLVEYAHIDELGAHGREQGGGTGVGFQKEGLSIHVWPPSGAGQFEQGADVAAEDVGHGQAAVKEGGCPST